MGLDYKDITNLLRLTTPEPNISRQGWCFDRPAVLKAMDTLGIRLPTELAFQKRRIRKNGGWTYGVHRCKSPGKHSVRICDTLWFYEKGQSHASQEVIRQYTLKRLNETCWHELAHCMQAERAASELEIKPYDFHEEVYRDPVFAGRWGRRYEGNFFEVEARQIAADNKHIMLIKYI